MNSSGDRDVEDQLRKGSDEVRDARVRTDEIWAYAAGELSHSRLEAVANVIATTPSARAELAAASFVMDDDAEPAASAVDVEPVMTRIRALCATIDWDPVDVRVRRTPTQHAPIMEYRVRLRTSVPCHVLLFAVTVDPAGVVATRLHPPEPGRVAPAVCEDWPSNPLSGGGVVELPPSGHFDLPTVDGFLVLCTRPGSEFDASTIAAVRGDLLSALRAAGQVTESSIGIAVTGMQRSDVHAEWRLLRLP